MEPVLENPPTTLPVQEESFIRARPKKEYVQVQAHVQLLEIEKGMIVEENGTERVVPSPYTSGLNTMEETFRRNAGKWIFRTIEKVHCAEEDYTGTAFYDPEDDGRVTMTLFHRGTKLPFDALLKDLKKRKYSLEKLKTMANDRGLEVRDFETEAGLRAELMTRLIKYEQDNYDDLMERQIETYYSKFYCFASEVPLRPGTPGENKAGRKRILLNSKNYGEPDFFNKMDFKMNRSPPPKKGDPSPPQLAIPREPRTVKGQKCTDIACILAVPGRGGLEAKTWFVCSPQLMRAWTAIMFKTHDTFSKIAPEEDDSTEGEISALRKKMFSGNYTITNSYLGWLMSCHQNGLLSNSDEIRKRFWNLRSEYASRAYIHVYSALVLMLRYHECPGPHNIPNKLDEGPHMRTWYLPQIFADENDKFGRPWLELLFEKYEIRVQDTMMRILDVPVVPQNFIPRGTRPFPIFAMTCADDAPEEDTAVVEKGPVSTSTGKWGDSVIDDVVE